MTFDEYNAYITSMTQELQTIAERTLNQALLGIADASNPMFIELMQRHAHLTKLSSEITEKMVAMMNFES
ncbi:hypothetical protein ACFQ0F_06830 [Paraperlucidibaca wandonensis]|uniref:Uncharacterized protein n=1 Tax=Paraperlucidibaca wandonensis TaxID=1268273 RepID=A0ABW3HFP7_9GAMM